MTAEQRVSDTDLPWLIAAYENDKNPATFRREVALALRELLYLRSLLPKQDTRTNEHG